MTTYSATAGSRRTESGYIWDIKKFALHDGPGIRTTVFLKGCPLRCLWCCNPESQRFEAELVWVREKCLACDLCVENCPRSAVEVDPSGARRIDTAACDLCGLCALRCPGEALNVAGRMMTVDEVLEEVSRDGVFYARSGGGMTLSGGEPLAQAVFAAELLRRYKRGQMGHTVVETCGAGDWADLQRLSLNTEVFLYDIKHMDPVEHRRLTGVDNQRILENARLLAQIHGHLIIRLPLIPGCNDSDTNVRHTAEFARSLRGVTRLDILPYHRLGEPKYARLNRTYELAGTPALSMGRVEAVRAIIESYGLSVRIGG